MNLRRLVLLVVALALAVALAWSNPSLEMYLSFVETELDRALDRHQSSAPNRESNMVRTIFRAHSHELVDSVVRPHTVRKNWGLFCFFETSALDAHIEVLGIGGHFVPIQGLDEAVLRFGRLAF